MDVHWQDKAIDFENNKEGIKKLIRKLKNIHEKGELSSVILEASGGYEKNLVKACHKHNCKRLRCVAIGVFLSDQHRETRVLHPKQPKKRVVATHLRRLPHHLSTACKFEHSRLWNSPRRSCEALFYPMSQGISCETFSLKETNDLNTLQDAIKEIAQYEDQT